MDNNIIKIIDRIIKEADLLPQINLKTITEHHLNIPDMLIYVNSRLTSHPDLYDIIGNNPLSVMYDNHKHHAAFMNTVLSVNNYELLAKSIPWVYRTYHSHGFKFEYFLIELKAWIEANNEYLDKKDADAVNVIYEWLICRHDDMILIALSDIDYNIPINENWLEQKNNFKSALLEGDHKKALALAKDIVKDSTLNNFYLYIIQPSMYEIGIMWEKAQISVAQEHLASAIIGRVMSNISMLNPNFSEESKYRGKALVSASPNEFHEIGAWMITDILEQDGWDVRYLGANMPKKDLILFIRSFVPDLLALSVTMPFNIDYTKDVIKQIKSDDDLKNIKVMIGGRIFNENKNLWKKTGADGFASNLEEAKELARKWGTL